MDDDTPGAPWVPDDVEPDGGWPVAPDVMPLVVSEWEPPGRRHGAWEAQPQRRSTPRAAIALKDDAHWGRERIRRFAQAWRWLREVRARSAPQAPVVTGYECNRYLAGAGVLVRIR